MKKMTLKIIKELKTINYALEQAAHPLFIEYLRSNRAFFFMLEKFIASADSYNDSPGTEEIIPCYNLDKLSSGAGGELAPSVILALLHDKLILGLRYLSDSTDRSIDRQMLIKVQENVDHSLKFI